MQWHYIPKISTLLSSSSNSFGRCCFLIRFRWNDAKTNRSGIKIAFVSSSNSKILHELLFDLKFNVAKRSRHFTGSETVDVSSSQAVFETELPKNRRPRNPTKQPTVPQPLSTSSPRFRTHPPARSVPFLSQCQAMEQHTYISCCEIRCLQF